MPVEGVIYRASNRSVSSVTDEFGLKSLFSGGPIEFRERDSLNRLFSEQIIGPETSLNWFLIIWGRFKLIIRVKQFDSN